MPAWKVLFICLFACVCLSLALATLLVPMSHEGGQRWLWLGGLLTTTLFASGLFALFLRHADGYLDAKTRGSRY
jgi:hypothetical protein